MPKLAWVFVAGALIGDRWGWWGMLGVVIFELLGAFITGFYKTWKADSWRGDKTTPTK